jgi:hypothetical protein
MFNFTFPLWCLVKCLNAGMMLVRTENKYNPKLATGWTDRGSNPGGRRRFSLPVQTGPGAHPASYTTGTGSFPGVDLSGRGVDHPPPSSADVKERVELYPYSPSGPSWLVIG